MPTQHTVTSYKFDELDDAAKDKARDWYCEGALDYEWWESTYDDAANIGLVIRGFDLGRGQEIEARFDRDSIDVARAIMKDHGVACDTYKLASDFIAEVGDAETTEEQDREFCRALKEEYWHILEKESEYLTSNECVDESIVANDYDFTADGKRF